MDAWARPGIPATDLAGLLTTCDCGLVTTQDAFDRHECLPVGDRMHVDAITIDVDAIADNEPRMEQDFIDVDREASVAMEVD